MKKFSVIIPAYNVEKYIAKTIQSVLEQTYQNFELLIVNDGSLDRTLEICQQFTDSRLKIISQKNTGLSGARNTGIRHSQGEYIAFLDGDDLWLPEKLQKHIQHLEKSPTVGVSFSRSAFIDERGNLLNSYQMPILKNITPEILLHGNPVGNGSALVVRREVLEAIKFQNQLSDFQEYCYFDAQFRRAEDIELLLRIALETSWQIEGIPEALTLYRVNSQGLSANWQEQLHSWEKVISKTKSYAPELVTRWEKSARAYQLQILARSTIRQKAGSVAVKLFNKALITYWPVMIKMPHKIILTGVAAYLLWLLPNRFYSSFEKVALKGLEIVQRLYIFRQVSKNTIS
ncbi:glycosyl transferase family 2 [Gloeothece citriformis PCC 7424]|uniref:Glycosyl transferase family 2 n=1 Tax=Gloeothece citriformis (strain PCC 7424) TaxID=65393 RepID=B7KAG8_GLOC7|nr:glycosyltransferase family 2 protein [Gloeothece citriformis]ACK72942.1 glycosyl transferase family 2 [Gloeothece citriformis PCC 7424]